MQRIKAGKSGEMSVSNALTSLTESNRMHRANGKYCAVDVDNDGGPIDMPDSSTDDRRADLPEQLGMIRLADAAFWPALWLFAIPEAMAGVIDSP